MQDNEIKVYSPGYQAIEWGFDYSQCVDLATALAQPCRIAVVPVYCDRHTEFSWRPDFATLNLQQFDLVLFTDIEWRSQAELMGWISSTGVKNWLLHVAGRWLDEELDPRVVYRPAWTFNFLKWNPARPDFPLQRSFAFDCLLGARREHRDFVMLNLQRHALLANSITTYRDIFVGHWINQTPLRISRLVHPMRLEYPYVSENLDPGWEVAQQLDNSISGQVPWEIYNRTWFSVVCETMAAGRVFLSAEKMGKCLQARRLFVVFAIQNFLQQYRNWGFETFGDVIDESYDLEANDILRWQKAFEQVRRLCHDNLPALIAKLKPRLDHNHYRLYDLEKQFRAQLQQLVFSYLK